MAEMSKDQILDRLANQFHNPKPDTTQIPDVYLRFGTVVSTGSSRAVINFAGGANIPNARYLTAIAPTAGTVCAILQYSVPSEETQYLVLGQVA